MYYFMVCKRFRSFDDYQRYRMIRWLSPACLFCILNFSHTPPAWATLSGTFVVGRDGDFPTLSAALDTINSSGIGGDVLLKIEPGQQTGPFSLGAFPGTVSHTLSISAIEDGSVILATDDSSIPLFSVHGAQNVLLEGLILRGATSSAPLFRIDSTSSNISLSACTHEGGGSGRLVEVLGSSVRAIRWNNSSFRKAAYGVYFDGMESSASDNRVSSCVFDSVQHGIYVSRQTNFSVVNCEIRPNLGTGSDGASGVTIAAQNPADSVFVSGNEFSGIRTSTGYAVAIRHNPLNSTAFLRASNNFIFGFQNTGSSQVRAIYVSGGQNRILNNSILVNDVAATGAAYSLYNGLVAADSRLTFVNNILVNLEATRPAYNAFMLTQAAAVDCDNNIYYGTGTGYRLGWLYQAFQTLASWQSGTGHDANSYSGDPQFASSADLHLQETSAIAHQNGAVVLDVPVDIDGEFRFQPPDIGADEFTYLAPPVDAAILNVIDLPTAFPEHSLLRIEVVVQNRGRERLSGLPLRLSYADTARAEVMISLSPSEADTFSLLWSTVGAHESAELIIEAVLGADANPSDNARAFQFAVVDQPLQGIYRVGGFDAHFNSLLEASTALSSQGVSGPVTLELAPGIYNDNLVLESVIGLSAESPLHVKPSPLDEGIVQLSPISGQRVILLSDVSFVTIEGLILQGSSGTLEGIALINGSHNNTIRNCRILCTSQEQSNASGVYIGQNCRDNTLSELDISYSYSGIRLDGSSSGDQRNNVIRECRVYNVRSCITASWQRSLQIQECELRAGYSGAPAPCYGIRISSLSPQDTVTLERNSIIGALASGSLTALSCEAGNGVLLAVNNWIGNFDAANLGPLTAVSVISGTAMLYFNTIRLGDVNAQSVTGIAVSGTQTYASLVNNIVEISDPDATARFIEWNSGSITANHNLYDAPGTNTAFRFASGSLDNEYQTLAAWIASTAQDSNSVSATAGFESSTGFHVRPDASGPSNRGLGIPSFIYDLDGEPRDSLPDIGADEYTFLPAVTDLAAESVELANMPAPAGEIAQVLTVVSNIGQTAVTDAEVTLLYNEVPLESRTVTLEPGAQTEQIWNWAAPQTLLAFGTLRLQVNAVSDVVNANNSLSQSIVIAGEPLADTVYVGMSRSELSTLDELTNHLKWRGVSSRVTVFLAPVLHVGPLVLYNIPGADSVNRVTISPAAESGAAITAGNSTAVIEFRDADFVTIDGVEILAGPGTAAAVLMDNMSCHNVVTNCQVSGSGSEILNTFGIRVSGTSSHGNEISGNTISGCYIGAALSNSENINSLGNVVIDNNISDVYYGVWVDHQHNALVKGNDIIPGSSAGPAGGCYGVYILQLGDEGSVRVEGNKIHGFLDSPGPRTNRACGVYSAPGITSYVEIVNNFIYGYSQLTSLRSRGVYLSSGNHLVANNSIRIGDSPADNDHAGIYVSTGTQHEIYNNCVMGYENDIVGYGIDVETGASILSDYNCMWGSSPSFKFAALGTQDFSSLSEWQSTGQDLHSLSAHARYVSSSDLHIQTTDTVLYARGLQLPEIPQDIDGDMRAAVPCIGADEYTLLTQLQPPAGLTVVVTSDSEVVLNWQPVAGASQYRIYGATTNNELETSPQELGTSTTASWIWDFSTDPTGFRFFQVRAE